MSSAVPQPLSEDRTLVQLISVGKNKNGTNLRAQLVAIFRDMYYVYAMIRSWKNAGSRKLWEEQRSQFRGLDDEFAIELLASLNVAKSLNDLSPMKSVGLHKLKGDRKNQWAMTVNARWRICFVFRDGDAFDVEIVDYHRG
jgi:toxin HigB-1